MSQAVVLLLVRAGAAARLPAMLFRALAEAAAPSPLEDASLRVAAMGWYENPAVARRGRGAITLWDVSRVRDFACLFCGVRDFNEPIGRWDTRRARDMSHMFHSATAFNQPLFFDTRRVRDMSYMFYNATAFNQPVSFDTRRVRDMRQMFHRTAAPLSRNLRQVGGAPPPGYKETHSSRSHA